MNQIIPLHRGSFKSEREAALHLIDTSEQEGATAWISCCSGPCEQGRFACPCPESCRVPEGDPPMSWVDLKLAILIVCFIFTLIACGPMVRGWFS